VERGQSLARILAQAFQFNEAVLVECRIDYSVNYDVFSLELGRMVCPE
jgi:acetolactate synthase-1/2/3 large subunit